MASEGSRLTIGFLLSWFGETYTQAIFSAAVQAASQRGINLVCFEAGRVNSPFEDNRYQVMCDLASPKCLDGMVVFSEGMDQFVSPGEMQHTLDCLYHGNLPITSVGAVPGVPSVAADLKSGMRELVGHLIETHGCRRIALIHGPESQDAAIALFDAYQESLQEHSIDYDPDLVTPPGVWGVQLGIDAVRYLMDERRVSFDAILGGDPEASGALEELRRHSVQVPYEVAVGGYNDLELARFTNPPLTTVHRPVSGTAKRAIDLLVELVEGRPAPELNLLPTRAVIRRSCGCIPETILRAAISFQPDEPQPALAAGGDALLRQVQHALREARLDLSGDWVDLLEKLIAEANGLETADPAQRYLAAYENTLQESLAGGRLDDWQDFLSILRGTLWPLFAGDLPALTRLDNLFQQSRVLLSSAMEQAEAERSARQRLADEILREVSRSLIAALDVPDLLDVLARELPKLGIPSCYLSLYEQPDLPTAAVRLIFAYDLRGRIPLQPPGLQFDGALLVPPEVLEAGRPFVWMVEPLFFGEQNLGFAVFEIGPLQGAVYSALRGQISSALRGAMLTEKNVELYNEAVRARQAAEEADRLKSRFLSMVSHELRTPLSLITGTVEMMESRQEHLPGGVFRDIDSIRASAEHLSRLIGDVLDLTSSQAGELRLNFNQVDLSSLLEDVSILAEPLARDKGLTWHAEVPAHLPVVYGDSTRLRQVVLNLVSNAIKFTQHGEVILRVQVKQNEVVIKIWDTGVGIPPEEQQAIFDEFRQSERTIQRGFGGMGLGLAISRRLVEMHGGRIGVISTGDEGAGSTFYFTLPIVSGSLGRAVKPTGQSSIVLLLGDHPADNAQMNEFLERRGFRVDTLYLAEQADWMNEIIARKPGALILDYEPAAEKGWEIIRAIKENPPIQDIPVIFYSFLPGQRTGALVEMDYLPKPLHSRQLEQALDRQGMLGDGCTDQSILVVEDDPDLLDLHSRMVSLALPACKVIRAADGQEALEIMRKETPSLVLLDLLMPVLDGFAVLEEMRSHGALRTVPVIVLTAQILSAAEMRRLQHGVAVVLEKGIYTTDEILSQVEATLNRSKHLGTETQRLVRQAIVFIHEHYAEDLTRKDLAQHIAVSERYLTRCFHQETGITPVAYLNRYRIRMAKTLLEAGKMSVTEVALAVGFSDSNYFGRVFRDEVGVSPGQYQKTSLG